MQCSAARAARYACTVGGPQTSSSSLDTTKATSGYSLLGHSLRAHRIPCHATMSKGILVYLATAEEFGFNVITMKPNAL